MRLSTDASSWISYFGVADPVATSLPWQILLAPVPSSCVANLQCSVQFSCSGASDSSQPHGLRHAPGLLVHHPPRQCGVGFKAPAPQVNSDWCRGGHVTSPGQWGVKEACGRSRRGFPDKEKLQGQALGPRVCLWLSRRMGDGSGFQPSWLTLRTTRQDERRSSGPGDTNPQPAE